MKAWIAVIVAMILLGPGGVTAGAGERTAEVNAYTTALASTNIDARITALKQISSSGLTEKSLFDLLKNRLLEGYESSDDDKQIDELAWLCKALASSGLADYREVLALVGEKAPNKKVRGYARQSLGLLESYAKRNALLAQQGPETEGLAAEEVRIVNLLRAPEVKLKRDAAKTITRSIATAPKVFAVVDEELLTLLHKGGKATTDELDTMAWLCRALGASGAAKYKGTLQEVINIQEKKAPANDDPFNAGNRSSWEDMLLKHAQQSLSLLK